MLVQAEAGERFVGFHSETAVDAAAAASAASNGASFSLPGLDYSPIRGGRPQVASSPAHGRVGSAKLNKINTDAFDASTTSASRMVNIAALVAGDENSLSWRKTGPSRTGTCCSLEASTHLSPRSAAAGSTRISPLQLVWRGDEPLDKLHIALKVKVDMFAACRTRQPCDLVGHVAGLSRAVWHQLNHRAPL